MKKILIVLLLAIIIYVSAQTPQITKFEGDTDTGFCFTDSLTIIFVLDGENILEISGEGNEKLTEFMKRMQVYREITNDR